EYAATRTSAVASTSSLSSTRSTSSARSAGTSALPESSTCAPGTSAEMRAACSAHTAVITARSSGTSEERELGHALAAEDGQIHRDRSDPALLGERDRLRLDLLCGEDAAAVGARRVDADAVEVARQLLDGIDRADSFDLDRDPAILFVAAHQVDGADVGRPLALDESQAGLDVCRIGCEQQLQVALDAVLLEPGRLAHVVRDVGEDLEQLDLQPVLAPPRA